MTSIELIELMKHHEHAEVEFKDGSGGLPTSLWETYSAYANSSGGHIFIGAEETEEGFRAVGVDSDKLQRNFWNNINNPQKVSENILANHHVKVVKVEDKDIISIYVPQASRTQKPIYVGANPLTGTFRRNYEGDYKCTANEIKRMFADNKDSQDDDILEHFGLDDLNMESVLDFRRRLVVTEPGHPWNHLEIEDFLIRIGAFKKDRKTGESGLTLAGLVMFGEDYHITDYIPQYFLDYREKNSYSPNERWSHRIISSDGTWTGNVYDFYVKIINRLTSDISIPFQLDDELRRISDTQVHQAIREALINALVHADYGGRSGIVIEKENNVLRFSNPGILRVPLERALRGGVSDPRNNNMFKMFLMLGLSERQGSGIEKIHRSWKEQQWKLPNLVEEYQPDRTILTLSTHSLLSEDSLNYLRANFGEDYEICTKDEVVALVTAYQEKSVNNERLQMLLNITAVEATVILKNLVKMNMLKSSGVGRWTIYNIVMKEEILESSAAKGSNSATKSSNSATKSSNSATKSSNSATKSSNSASDDILIGEITVVLDEKKRVSGEIIEKIILDLCRIRYFEKLELCELLNRKEAAVRRYLRKLTESGHLELLYPNILNHPKQAYKTVKKAGEANE